MEYEILDDLKKIKKEYGENMSHLCRELFSTILEKPGFLYHILSTHFAKSKDLYDDIVNAQKKYEFKEYIYHFWDLEKSEDKQVTKSVKELLEEAGYELFECKTNEDIKKFRKYYKSGEELCTFRDSYRIDNHYIFFIVKKDVDKIKREDFNNPKREDLYSTSVLDLQFDKGNRQRVSIKSRYNHTVSNPDATYSNNLDSIAPGLTDAFEHDYGFNIGSEYKYNFELEDYVEARDGKFYKYNYEINNIHYCPNNIIIDNGYVIDKYSDKSRYTFMDYFILDESEKKIIIYDKNIHDSFVDGFQNITSIEITNKEDYKEIKLIIDGDKEAIIKLDKRGRIIGYINDYLTDCEDDFLRRNKVLKELDLTNLTKCEYYFLEKNEKLEEINLPNLTKCGDNFLYSNEILKEINLPNLTECGICFLLQSKFLKELNLPNLRKCGDYFLGNNIMLQNLDLPNLTVCGWKFLHDNEELKELSLPNLTKCESDFLTWNKKLKKINLPNLTKCGNCFLYFNEVLEEIYLPKLSEDYYHYLSKLCIKLIKKSKKNTIDYYKDADKIEDKNNSHRRLKFHHLVKKITKISNK